MLIMLVIWVSLVVRIVRRTLAEGTIGLPAALVLTMSFLYAGCFVYAVPGYTHLRAEGNSALLRYDFTEWTVVQGAFASLLGLLGFAIGAGVFRKRNIPAHAPSSVARTMERRIILLLGSIGLLGFAVHYVNLSFPMSDALNEAARNVGLVAVCLGSYVAWREGSSLLFWIILAALVPLYYIVLFGFASYGFLFGIVLLSFGLSRMRRDPREFGLRALVLAFISVWLTLTAFIGWFSFREEIRRVVWLGEEGSVWQILSQAIAHTEIFSPWNFDSLDLVNIRLNLPLFIGKMIEHHALYPDLQQHGETLILLPLAVLPRFIWPDKPERGGSSFMSEHTGLVLSDSATFGTGTVFEFYINFGYSGVLLGFMGLGWIIRQIDRSAYTHLLRGRLFDFARLFVVGIVAIDPLLRPFFIFNGAIFAWLLMTALKLVFSNRITAAQRSADRFMADRQESLPRS